jgi:hypothetical protein
MLAKVKAERRFFWGVKGKKGNSGSFTSFRMTRFVGWKNEGRSGSFAAHRMTTLFLLMLGN